MRGILLHMTIPNGLSEEVTFELRIELSNEQAMKISSRIVFQKRRNAKALKVLHAFSFSSQDYASNAPGMGSGLRRSVTVTIYQVRPLQLPKCRYRIAYSETEMEKWELGPGNFYYFSLSLSLTHTHTLGPCLSSGSLWNTGASFCLNSLLNFPSLLKAQTQESLESYF